MTIDKSEKIKHLPTQKRRVLLSLEANYCRTPQIVELVTKILGVYGFMRKTKVTKSAEIQERILALNFYIIKML